MLESGMSITVKINACLVSLSIYIVISLLNYSDKKSFFSLFFFADSKIF